VRPPVAAPRAVRAASSCRRSRAAPDRDGQRHREPDASARAADRRTRRRGARST
jgi:hypothetical protein